MKYDTNYSHANSVARSVVQKEKYTHPHLETSSLKPTRPKTNETVLFHQ